jgi:fatty acid desaturase
MSTPRPFFRYHPVDGLLALSGVGIVALILWTFLGFHTLSWWLLAPAFIAIMWSYCWNLQCISHNFIHNPYFTNEWLNRAFGLLETVALGVPHILYHHYHLNHHFGDNDKKGPDGKTRDWSSIYRYGKNDEPENFWSYIFISYFRAELVPVVRKCFIHGPAHIGQLLAETVVLVTFWAVMLAVDWRYVVYFYLPSYYLGWVLSYAEGYLEHYRCQPDNHFANSVSSYHRLYNLLWFNNGYHQEHHWAPKAHWTTMEQVRARIQPEMEANGTRILRGPHMTALFEDWLNENRQQPAAEELRRAA